jgi:hypothetical protein
MRPEYLPRRQVLYLDAIEESFGMASLAYGRLQESLVTWISLRDAARASSPERSDELSRTRATILLDAWSLVDILNRLRVMVGSMPGLKTSSSGIRSFLRSVASIEDLRNGIQHLSGQVNVIAETGHPVWGTLSWAVPPVEPGDPPSVFVFVPGTSARVKGIPIVNPLGRWCEQPVGLIELTAAGVTVSLSEMVAAVARFSQRLELASSVAFASPRKEGARIVFDVVEDV